MSEEIDPALVLQWGVIVTNKSEPNDCNTKWRIVKRGMTAKDAEAESIRLQKLGKNARYAIGLCAE